jgi:orotidine-5'-phosphate decarboxylase
MKSLIVALDLPTAPEALALVDRLGEQARYFKVGAQLFTREGPP